MFQTSSDMSTMSPGGLPSDFTDMPPELQDIMDEMKANQLAKIDQIGKDVAKKRDLAVKGRKQSGIEDIWEEDESYYQGVDDANRESHPWIKSAATTGGISRQPQKSNTRCTSFFNITRQFVESASARMGDILLPAGDWNFAIKPTPLPDDGNPDNQQPLGQLSGTDQGQQVITQQQKDAETKSVKAETWIKDKLVECQYHTEVRKVIEDSAKLGTGIIKGPFPEKLTSRKTTTGTDGKVALELEIITNPASRRIDPWDFFPDPCCGDDIHNGNYIVEHDRVTAKQLKDMKGLPGYLSDQIDQVLDEGPNKRNYEGDSRRPDSPSLVDDELFDIWYFYGLIDVVGLSAMEVKIGDKDSAKDMLPAIVTLVNDTAIKAAINPMDTGAFPYDVMPWQRVNGTWTGIGIARQGRTPQDMLNAAGRALMDNAGLSSGPMIIIRDGAIAPADGKWELTARKVWRATEQADIKSVADAFTAINIPMVQPELTAIIQLAYKMMEDATGIAYLLQGQQGSAPDTVGGMELLHRNASAILRRLARVFDERVTEPHIRRYYDWLLMHGPDDAKGDMRIEAIGSTALVEREIQANDSMVLLQLSVNPAFGIDPAKAMTEVLKVKRFIPDKWQRDPGTQPPAPMIPAIEVQKLKSADLDKTLQAKQWEAKVDANVKMHAEASKDDRDTKYVEALTVRDQANASQRYQELAVKRELAMLEYASKHQISLDQIKASLAKTSMQLREQRILSRLGTTPAPQVAEAAAEPPAKARDGFAFQE